MPKNHPNIDHFLTESFGDEEGDDDEPNKRRDTQNWDHILR